MNAVDAVALSIEYSLVTGAKVECSGAVVVEKESAVMVVVALLVGDAMKRTCGSVVKVPNACSIGMVSLWPLVAFARSSDVAVSREECAEGEAMLLGALVDEVGWRRWSRFVTHGLIAIFWLVNAVA